MKAKKITGEHCAFCGNDSLPLVKTKCCERFICCDTDYLSFRGGGRCQFQHENYSICHFHYNEKHQEQWQECKECRDFFGSQKFDIQSKYSINTPKY